MRDWQGLSRELGLYPSGEGNLGTAQRGTKLAIKRLQQMPSVYGEVDTWVLRTARPVPDSTHRQFGPTLQ